MANAVFVGLLVAVMCSSVYAQCDTDAKVTEVQLAINSMASGLGLLGTNYSMILHTVCNNDTYKGSMQYLEAEVAKCPALLSKQAVMTAIGQLTIAGKSFFVLLNDFPSVSKFCDCSPNLLQAWAGSMEFKDKWYTAVAGGAYANMTDPAIACSANATALLTMVEKAYTTCEPIFKQSGFTKKAFTSLIYFNSKACPMYNAQNYMCATTTSALQEFKNCITHENQQKTTDDGADSNKCKRRSCVKDSFGKQNCTADSIEVYIKAVNVVAMGEIASGDDECGAASSIRIPSVLIVATIILRSFL